MIAVQVKSGGSYFKEMDGNGVIYYIDKKHRNYWINHSFPVIIVIYSPTLDDCICEIANNHTLIRCYKNWKIRIPKTQTINNSCLKLCEIANDMRE